jgi:predicted alternative tryptophan synthase beta-subunit
MMPETKVVLTEQDLPMQWYNLQADPPFPLPPVIHPGTGEPADCRGLPGARGAFRPSAAPSA